MSEGIAEVSFGQYCPVGKVQIEFVGAGGTCVNGYGWNPSESAFIDAWVDGQRFRIALGNIQRMDGSIRRGVHICGPIWLEVDKHSLSALDVMIKAKPEDTQ